MRRSQKREARVRQAAIGVAAAVITAACAGPQTPLDIASKEVPIDLLLGKRAQAVAEAPVPPLLIPSSAFEAGGVFSGDRITPPPATARPPAPPGDDVDPECPERDPLKAPRLVARNVIERPPVPATYSYQTDGKWALGDGQVVTFAPTSTVTVGNIVQEDRGWTFDVTVENSAAPPATTTTYRVLNAGADTRPPTILVTPPSPPPTAPRPGAVGPGLYMARIDDFAPPFPGLAVARFPLEAGDFFDSSASDGRITITQRTTVEKRFVYDACGVPVDTWLLTISGRIADASDRSPEVVEIGQIIALASQYGGVFMLHRKDVRSGGAATSVQLNARAEPQEPK